MESLLTKKQVAELCGFSMKTIERAIAKGELKALKFSRAVKIRKEDFEAWLKSKELDQQK